MTSDQAWADFGAHWQNCPACEGIGGHFDGNMQWIDCPECEGAEGWMEWAR